MKAGDGEVHAAIGAGVDIRRHATARTRRAQRRATAAEPDAKSAAVPAIFTDSLSVSPMLYTSPANPYMTSWNVL